MKFDVKKYVISVAIPLAVGGLSALVSGGASGFADIVKPPLTPPGWVFPVVWTVLYILMGSAFYLVWTADKGIKDIAFFLYFLQLAMNFLWPVFFFRLQNYGLAFFWLLALLAAVILTAFSFKPFDIRAFYLMIPYIVWVAFAGYINFGVLILN